jgi:predicted small lipoprotein YifL
MRGLTLVLAAATLAAFAGCGDSTTPVGPLEASKGPK